MADGTSLTYATSTMSVNSDTVWVGVPRVSRVFTKISLGLCVRLLGLFRTKIEYSYTRKDPIWKRSLLKKKNWKAQHKNIEVNILWRNIVPTDSAIKLKVLKKLRCYLSTFGSEGPWRDTSIEKFQCGPLDSFRKITKTTQSKLMLQLRRKTSKQPKINSLGTD